jgi:hypothetical protein
MAVDVLDNDGRSLNPCSEKRARILLKRKRADVIGVDPFIIKLLDRTQKDCNIQSSNSLGVEKYAS